MRKVFQVVLVLSIILVMSACGQGNGDDDPKVAHDMPTSKTDVHKKED